MEQFRQRKRSVVSASENGRMVLWQIKKVLHCHFPDFQNRLSSLSDPRKGGQYGIAELVTSAVVLFLLKCDSRNDFNQKTSDELFRRNYWQMFRLRVPHMDAVNDLFEKMKSEELESLRCRLIGVLIEKRALHGLRFFEPYFHVAVDGTGVYNWGDSPPEDIVPHALKREYDSGKVNYSTQVLEAALICRNGASVPLMSEWIANDASGRHKQDCEQNAFKRLSVRLKKYFPRLNICILADGLYSNASMMDLCKRYGWKFVTVFKDGNLPSVWEEVDSLLSLKAGDGMERILGEPNRWISRKYRWIKDIEYQKRKICWIECVQESTRRDSGEKRSVRFVFLTNLDANRDNIVDIVMSGRARWRIEDHFNAQKNRGGALRHKFNRKCFLAIKNWHGARQLAAMIIQLVEHTREIMQARKENAKLTLKELWKNLNAFLSMCSADEDMAEFERWSAERRQVRLE